jgi:hypothetical protein
LDLRRGLILRRRYQSRPHRAADGCRDLNQPSRICVIFFEQLGGSVPPRGLIEITRCRRVVFQACTRCGHVASELAPPRRIVAE